MKTNLDNLIKEALAEFEILISPIDITRNETGFIIEMCISGNSRDRLKSFVEKNSPK